MRVVGAWAALAAAVFICTGGALGCNGCGARALAELTASKGAVERDLAASVGQWKGASVGARFVAGDGLRTAADATATLRVGRKGRVLVESDTTIRFSTDSTKADDEGATGLAVEQGAARVEAGDEELALKTELGRAILRAGGSMVVARVESGTRYRVLMGGAMFDAADGTAKKLTEGESITVGLGTAVLEAASADEGTRSATKNAALLAAKREAIDAGADASRPNEPSKAAVTATITGSVRKRGSEDDAWSPLAQGPAQLAADDELEVGASARASLQRGSERAVLEEGRYQVGAADAPLIRAIDGNVQLEASEGQDVRIAVPGGMITAIAVAGGTRARVAVRGKDGGAQIAVERGQVKASGGDTQLALAQGERGELSARAAAAVARPAIDRAELVVPAGELFRVYDPKPPTAVGFSVSKACGEAGAELRVEGLPPARGRDQINVAIGPGIHDYAVHCLQDGEPMAKPALRTKVRIVRNDGGRKLPMTPPKNDVSVDGRRYTLIYQNLKPVITAKWRDAPKAQGYVFHVTPPGAATLSMRTSQPQIVVPANALKDGTHRIQFEAAGQSKVASKETLVDVVFDNAAPTASLELPSTSGFAPTSKVTVAGVAVEGSRVSAGGTSLTLDGQQRFRAEVPFRSGDRAVAVRVQHPRHGIRYYLRRASP